MSTLFKNLTLTTLLIVLTLTKLKGQNMQSTNFSAPDCIVLQICSQEFAGETTINGKSYRRTAAFIFLPGSGTGTTISCPLNYFQESCSIPQKWIQNDQGTRISLTNIDKLSRVVITKKTKSAEEKINISESVSNRLFNYFKLDVEHNSILFKGFDCYAFQSFLGNVIYFPRNPSWDYKEVKPEIGNCIILTTDEKLPESIKHWAVYLGEDMYLSKFGRGGEGAQALVTVMTLEGMKYLYDCKKMYTAYPKLNAQAWNGYKPQ